MTFWGHSSCFPFLTSLAKTPSWSSVIRVTGSLAPGQQTFCQVGGQRHQLPAGRGLQAAEVFLDAATAGPHGQPLEVEILSLQRERFAGPPAFAIFTAHPRPLPSSESRPRHRNLRGLLAASAVDRGGVFPLPVKPPPAGTQKKKSRDARISSSFSQLGENSSASMRFTWARISPLQPVGISLSGIDWAWGKEPSHQIRSS